MEVHLEETPVLDGRVHRRGEDHGAGLSGGLCLVERDVGVTEQLFGRRTVACSNADARGHIQGEFVAG